MDLGVSIFRTNGFGIHNWNEILYNSGTKFGMLSTNRNDKECLLYLQMGILVYRYTQEVPFYMGKRMINRTAGSFWVHNFGQTHKIHRTHYQGIYIMQCNRNGTPYFQMKVSSQ